jgi:3-deoxy-manno-octulosonate cytidylyltransferase (CMP-KDO synthetase)
MVVHVAERAHESGARRVVVATDSEDVVAACERHGVEVLLTSAAHATGTDRVAEAAQTLDLPAERVIVNVQGDEPFVPPQAIARVAALLAERADCEVATAAHRIESADEFFSPNVVKVVLDRSGRALLFSRAPIPWARDAFAAERSLLPPALPALRHVGLYAYRSRFLRDYARLARPAIEDAEALEQLRVLWNGSAIAVATLDGPLPPGVDTEEDLERARRVLAERAMPKRSAGTG